MLLKKYLIGLACATALLAPSATADDMTADEKIAHSMTAAPASISAKATIIDLDGTVLREGSNGWTCMPGVSLVPGNYYPMCNDAVWMAWMKAAAAGEPFSTDVIGFSYMLQGDGNVNNDDPGDREQNEGENWVKEGPHLMMLFPSTDEMKGLSSNPNAAGPYIMWGKTPMVHVMVPIGSRD